MPRTPFWVVISLSLLALGCQREEPIETYRVSKELQPSLPASSTAATPKAITWDTPTGWLEQAPSSMRLGSFLITGSNGQTADVSVIALSGPAGGLLANINRWRGQIDLAPIAEADLSKNSQTIEPAGRPMLWVDFVSSKKRLIAAIYTQNDRTWFFKMLGEDTTVENAKPAFLRFLQSLRFHAPS